MTNAQAIQRYLQKSPKAIQMISRIKMWNPKMSLTQNASHGKFNTIPCAMKFYLRFGLSHNGKVGRPRGKKK